jgi:hypothetical protein
MTRLARRLARAVAAAGAAWPVLAAACPDCAAARAVRASLWSAGVPATLVAVAAPFAVAAAMAAVLPRLLAGGAGEGR